MQVDEAIARVRSGPSGPSIGAFFDFDGTLIAGYSAVLLYEDLILARKVGVGQMVNLVLSELRGRESEAQFEEFMTTGMQVVRGHTEAELDEIGERLFRRRMAGQFYPQAWQLLGAHRVAGHTIVIASSASRFQIESAARELGIEHILYTKLEVRNGVLTGCVDGKPLWGTGKSEAVRAFADEHGIDLDRSYAYGNGREDVAYLATVANPVALNPGKDLTAAAAERGWPIVRFRDRGRIPGAVQIARSALGATGLVTGAVAGFARGALGGSRRSALDGMTTTATELTLYCAGIDVDVVGAEHARAPRPAVYIFNHQSVLDPIIVGKVLGGGFAGLVPRDMAKNPVLGPILRLGGENFLEDAVSFEDGEATSSLAPVVDSLRSGRSIIVAPEGTRSLTPRLGPFEMGAFHIARRAEVPIVPIVLRNSGEVCWRNSILVGPGPSRLRCCPRSTCRRGTSRISTTTSSGYASDSPTPAELAHRLSCDARRPRLARARRRPARASAAATRRLAHRARLSTRPFPKDATRLQERSRRVRSSTPPVSRSRPKHPTLQVDLRCCTAIYRTRSRCRSHCGCCTATRTCWWSTNHTSSPPPRAVRTCARLPWCGCGASSASPTSHPPIDSIGSPPAC